MTGQPLVTILVPARNEEAHIRRCLEAVLAQDYPDDRMEIVMVDGASSDRTASVARDLLATRDVRWKVIANPAATTPSNLNAGLRVASGDVVCRVDARSFVPPQYVRRCASILGSRPDVAVVGGAQVARAGSSSALQQGIARALNNRLAMGGARYRSGASSGPDDTVYLGAFRASQLRELGGWNEALSTNQDFDLNRRMSRFGLVWFEDSIPVEYRPRADLLSLGRQYHRFGRSKVVYWLGEGQRPLRRQWVMLSGGVVATTGALLAVLASERRGRVMVAMGAAGLAAGLAVDEAGSDRRGAGPLERLLAVAAMITVVGGWLSGVVRGLAAATRGPAR